MLRGQARSPSAPTFDRGQHISERNIGRQSSSRRGTVTAIEAIVRQDDRGPSKGATEGSPPVLLPDASVRSGSPGVDAVVTALMLAASRRSVSAASNDRTDLIYEPSVRAYGRISGRGPSMRPRPASVTLRVPCRATGVAADRNGGEAPALRPGSARSSRRQPSGASQAGENPNAVRADRVEARSRRDTNAPESRIAV